jgi:hypothetical protein
MGGVEETSSNCRKFPSVEECSVRNTIRFYFPMLMNVLNIHQKDE